MRPWVFGRLPPVGGAIGWREALAVLGEREPAAKLRAGLTKMLGVEAVSLHASGRESLRVAFAQLAAERGRSEVIVPAYTCWSVPAAAVAAGLSVRLVDVTLRGQIDLESLAGLPLERAAAVVVCNLLGVPEPVAPVRALVEPAGVAIIDDAAQALGASAEEGPVGGRGDVGVLSFARGKPLSALGGGGLAWRRTPAGVGVSLPKDPAPSRLAALARAAAYDLALLPWSFRLLAAIPSLGIGETVYDPGFSRGGIGGASAGLAAARLETLETCRSQRSERADTLARRLRERTRFEPLTAESGTRGAYPRLGVLAPSDASRNRALALLADLGATRLYPGSLERIEGFTPENAELPGAHAFSERLLTLPVHAGLDHARADEIASLLERVDASSSVSETRAGSQYGVGGASS